jgi:putative two-component system response regulator
LIVDDDVVGREILAHALEELGYEITVAGNGREALELMRSCVYRLVISDWEMPEMTGIELCRHIRQRYSSGYVYIILLTARVGTQNIVAGLEAGADDFITKPFVPQELFVRIRAGQRVLSLESREVTIFSMAKLAESRDSDTGGHLERVREYCRVIAHDLAHEERFLDEVDGDYAELIYMTSPLHDIGKVGIPDAVLLKPGPLTPAEFDVMKQHTIIGSMTLDAAARAYPDARFLGMARDIARSHHEHFDGGGYPDGLIGERIPLCGRIVALADVYDALTTKRVYKPAFSHEKAREIIIAGRGGHFDPVIVDAFLANEQRFLAIRDEFAEGASPKALYDSAPRVSVPASAETMAVSC